MVSTLFSTHFQSLWNADTFENCGRHCICLERLPHSCLGAPGGPPFWTACQFQPECTGPCKCMYVCVALEYGWAFSSQATATLGVNEGSNHCVNVIHYLRRLHAWSCIASIHRRDSMTRNHGQSVCMQHLLLPTTFKLKSFHLFLSVDVAPWASLSMSTMKNHWSHCLRHRHPIQSSSSLVMSYRISEHATL